MKLDHIGYAVHNIDAALDSFLELGYNVSREKIQDDERKVTICFLRNSSGTEVELIEPLEEGSPVDNWLRKNGSAPYHLCYESDDLEADLNRLSQKGFMTIAAPQAAPAMDNRRVAFLYDKRAGLLELAERKGALPRADAP